DFWGEALKVAQGIATLAAVVVFGSIVFVRDLPVAFHISATSPFTEFLSAGGFSVYSVLFMICLLHVLLSPESNFSKLFSSRWLVSLGAISYSVYLWHTAIFGGLDIALASLNRTPLLWGLKTAIRFATAVLVGYASFRFIEFPLLKHLARN